MAYQPKSYRKFVATAATATLVATAFAPFASAHSFKDVEEKYNEAVDFLVSKGVNGYADGTFKTQKTITRLEAAEILGKALGLTEVTDAPASGFADVPARVATLINAFKAKGITSGKTATTFGSNDEITRGELAIWLQRAYELKAKEGSTNNFTDVADNYKAAVQALVDNSITQGTSETTFGTTANAKRGDFALFVKRAADAAVVEEVAIESVSAINAKTIEVKFNTAVEDTSKAVIEVLRGTSKQNVTATWSEDKTSVQLAAASNLQAAEYTVNIKGLAEETLKGSVKVEAQKVAAIEILDEVAILSKAAVDGSITDQTATVGYVVKDQYGTDITKNTTLTTNNDTATGIKASAGTITLNNDVIKGKKVGDLVPVVLIHQQSGVTKSAVVKLSQASAVAAVKGLEVLDKNGKAVELKDSTVASETFLTVELTDQYGKVIDPAKATGDVVGVIVTNTNPLVAKLASDKIKVETINGKKYFVVKFANVQDANESAKLPKLEFRAGTADIMFISTANGEKFNHSITVADTAATDGVTLSQPELAVAKDADGVKIPLTVTDKDGNVITDTKLLVNAVKGIKVSGKDNLTVKDFEVKDGQLFLIEKHDAAGFKTLVVTTSTNKVATLTYEVKAEAKPAVITGVKAPIVLSTVEGAKEVTLNTKNHFIIEDQYGRVMKDEVATITVAKADAEAKAVTVEGTKVTAAKKGTETLVVKLATELPNTDSSIEVKVQVTDGNEFSAYEVEEIGLVEASDTGFALTVNGVLNGGKVKLQPSEYTAKISGGQSNKDGLIAKIDPATKKVTVPVDALNKDDKGNIVDTEFTVNVTVNATGEVITQKFTASNKAAVTQDFFFTSSVYSEYDKAVAITTATLESGASIATELKIGEDLDRTVKIATVDQYGTKAVKELAASTITVVPAKVGEVSIKDNGTATPKITLAENVEKATVTLKVTVGKAVKDITVNVVKPTSK